LPLIEFGGLAGAQVTCAPLFASARSMETPTATPTATPRDRLSWPLVLLWWAILLPAYCYGMRDFIPRGGTAPMPLVDRVGMFLMLAVLAWLVLLPFCAAIWRRLPRARGVLILLSVVTLLFSITPSPRPRAQQGAVPGAGCIPLSAVHSRMSPPEIYAHARACVAADRLADAARLNVLGASFGSFDTLRVRDRTAHQARMMLPMLALQNLEPGRLELVRAELLRVAKDPAELAAACREMRRIGPPAYEPRYMIEHGMAAMTGSRDPALVAGFDPVAAWKQTLDRAAHCPAES
jgi:hypothetical protein